MSVHPEVERLVNALLYEGYVLWPYRRSARKNQQRWTFGGVYPRAYSETSGGVDPWVIQTECLVVGPDPVVAGEVRFLHLVERQALCRGVDGALHPVDAVEAAGHRYLTWDEATERRHPLPPMPLPHYAKSAALPLLIPGGQELEALEDGAALMRTWHPLEARIEVQATRVQGDVFRLTLRVVNTSPWGAEARPEVLPYTLLSAHVVLTVEAGTFVSMTDPPPDLQEAAAACQNIKMWPVLAGEEGDRSTILSSPIILYDYPKVAPESHGDLFDSTEIDHLLLLNTLALTENEKEEIRASDPRARLLLDRAEQMTPQDFASLNGAIREFSVLRGDGAAPSEGHHAGAGWGSTTAGVPVAGLPAEATPPAAGRLDSLRLVAAGEEIEGERPAFIEIAGRQVRAGSQVILRPRSGRDVFDLALAGRSAVVQSIEQDYEDRLYLAVTVDDDPGRDLGADLQPGHRFFFQPDEIEPAP